MTILGILIRNVHSDILQFDSLPTKGKMMINTSSLPVFTARDAKAKFGEVLDTALGRPVGITKHDRLTAYIVSKMQFESMMDTIQKLEDQLWLAKADAARAEGFASANEVSAFLQTTRDDDEPAHHKTST